MSERCPHKSMPRRARSGRRPGAVLAVVLVCLAVAGALAVSLLRTAAAGRRAADARLRHAQAEWLAESGLERAAARLAANPQYAGEVWTTSEIDGGAGVVRIEVEAAPGQPGCRAVRVQADFPNDPLDFARQTKQAIVRVRMPTTNVENEP